jgi:hypothetical protein
LVLLRKECRVSRSLVDAKRIPAGRPGALALRDDVKRILHLTLLLALAGAACPALGDEAPQHTAYLALFHPVATSRHPETEANVRLSLFYGRVGSLHGLDLNAAVSRVGKGGLRGVAWTTYYAHVVGEQRGLMATLGVNRVQGYGSGVQAAGIANYHEAAFKGVQLSSLFNFAAGEMNGIQATTLYNLAEVGVTGIQLSGVASIAGGFVSGAQLSGLFNHANGGLKGVQLAALNSAPVARGLQAGVINLADESHGLQLGILNVADRHHGLPLGLVNVSHEDGNTRWVTAASSHVLVSTGVRTESGIWYSTLSAGWGDYHGGTVEATALSWQFGPSFALAPAWDLNVDLGFAHVMPEENDLPNHPAVQLRCALEHAFTPSFAAFAGVGLEARFVSYDDTGDASLHGVVHGGVALF